MTATVVHLFLERLAHGGNQPALVHKRADQFETFSWNELADEVSRWTAALVELGITPGDRVAQLSENRYEWVVADLAILMAQAVHVPVHATLSAAQVAYQVDHSGASLVLVSTQKQAAKLQGLITREAKPVRCLCYDGRYSLRGNGVAEPMASVVAKASKSQGSKLREAAAEKLNANSLATILYTSGTTGQPKGVMLSHGNLASNGQATVAAFQQREDELRLNFLPLSHSFARTCDLMTWLVQGYSLALAERPETVVENAAQLSPSLLCGVPYFFEKLHGRLHESGSANQPGKVREVMGGKVRAMFSGGAPLSQPIFEYYQQQEVPVLEGYGLTEASPVVTASSDQGHRAGAVGRAIPGVEVAFASDGELLTRGPNVMQGYWQDAPATAEVIDSDGWLHTGDLGYQDPEGFIFLTGRKKELLVTSGGKNIAPHFLEGLLTQDRFILQAMVIGDQRKHLAALIVPDPDVLRNEIKRRKLWVFTKRMAVSHRKVKELYQKRISHLLQEVAEHEQIRSFRVLARGFTVESGELTPKGSLRREVIAKHFAAEIESLYGP